MYPLETMLDSFRESLRRPDLPVVLAVSGGADSVALARAWQATQRAEWGRAIVAHFNHQLRGDDAQADEQFVQELAQSLGLSFVAGRPPATAGQPRGGLGPEATARRARYAFLAHTAAQEGARYLVTAHTADDQVETVLLRILRGTGMAGLSGIPQFRRMGEGLTVVRPLLDCRRDALRDYLSLRGQPFRVDASNFQPRYARNRVRHRLLPLLRRRFNPQIDAVVLRLAESARETQAARTQTVEWLAGAAVTRLAGGAITVRRPQLAQVPRDLVRQLFVDLWAAQHWPARDMNRARWDELAALALGSGEPQAPSARVFPGGIRAVVIGDSLTLTPPGTPPRSRTADT